MLNQSINQLGSGPRVFHTEMILVSCFERIVGTERTDRRTDRVQRLMRSPIGWAVYSVGTGLKELGGSDVEMFVKFCTGIKFKADITQK